MSTPAVSYISSTEAVVGEGHATLTDVANRPLKDVISKSGIAESVTGFTGFLGVFNVKAFGAVGDGVTDDTAAIQDAITSCGAAGGGVVFFPRGTYGISAQLTIDADGVELEGASDRTSIVKVLTGAPHFQNAIYGIGRTNIGIRRLKVDANSAARLATIGTVNVTCAIFLSASTDVRLERVTVTGTVGGSSGSGVGIAIGGTPNVRVTVENCKAIDCGLAGRNSDGFYMGSCEQGLISNCIAKNCLDTGFVLESCNYSGIAGCTASGCGLGGAISSSVGDTRYGNYINGLAVYDWNSVNTGGVELVTIGTSSNLHDSVISNVTMRHGTGAGPGVKAWRGSGDGNIVGVVISNVKVDGASTQGIILLNTQEAVVSGCNVRNTDGVGIQVDDGCSDIVVEGCRVTMKDAVTVGMCTNGSPTNILFLGNAVKAGAGASYGIYHYGTGTRIADLFNVMHGTFGVQYVGSDAGTVPVVLAHDNTNDGGLTFGKAAKRLVNWSAAGNALTLDPDSIGLSWGAASTLKAPTGYRNTVDGWSAASTAAGQSDVALTRSAGDWTALRAGSLTGVALRMSANAAGSAVSVTVFKNGLTTGLTATIAPGSSFGSQVSAVGSVPFNAGDILSLRITTAAGWTATAAIPYAFIDVAV